MTAVVPRRTILIVEDEPFVAEVVKCALEDRYDIHWVADVPGALARIGVCRPDMTIIDCFLPGGSLAELLAKADLFGLPVLLMSGDAEMLQQFGPFGYPCLHKPFTLEALLSSVGVALQARWRTQDAA